jgi:hypothetical protein
MWFAKQVFMRTYLISLAVAASVAACGDGNDGELQGQSALRSAPASAQRQLSLTPETLAAYERGLKKEIEAVRAAQQRSASAKTAQERGEAIQAAFETATIPLGAQAAQLPEQQYRKLRENVNDIFRTLDIQGKIEGPISMDLSRVDAATKQRLSRDPFSDLSPESAAELRKHMDRLVPVWIEYINLTAVAG